MRIELKNVQINHTLSEETFCYTATIYVDGKRAFEASNHGHGGPDSYQPVRGYTGPSEQEIDAWLKANRAPDTTYGITIDHSFEIEVGELLNAHVAAAERRRVTKAFDKILAKQIAALRDGKLVTWKAPPTPDLIAKVRTSHPTVEILNGADAATIERGLLAYCPDLAKMGAAA